MMETPLPATLGHVQSVAIFVNASYDTAAMAYHPIPAIYEAHACAPFQQNNFPSSSTDVRNFQRAVVEELREPLSQSIIARSDDINRQLIRSHKGFFKNIPTYVESGIITPRAGDALVQGMRTAYRGRFKLALGLCIASNAIGAHIFVGLEALAAYLESPWIAAVIAPGVYGLSWLLYGAFLAVGGDAVLWMIRSRHLKFSADPPSFPG